MFDRFTDRARKVMGLSRQEAQELGHDWIGSEHILLGCVRGGTGVAGVVLAGLGVTREAVRRAVRRVTPSGKTSSLSALPFTPQAKLVLEASAATASRLGHNYIGTEHLLLAILDVEDNPALEVLRALEIEPVSIRRNVEHLLGLEKETAPRTDLAQVLKDALKIGVRRSAGDSRSFGALFDLVLREPMPVLLRSPSPAKRLAFVQKAHALGPGVPKPLVVLDCARLSESDLERDLFSLVVPDPASDLRTQGGTLFLDCVDALPRKLQERLLLVLKTASDSRVSPFAPARRPLERLRIMAGTSLDLGVLVQEGKFHVDLFRRLNQISVNVPDNLEPPVAPRTTLSQLEWRGFRDVKVPTPEEKADLVAKALAPTTLAVLVRAPSVEARSRIVKTIHEDGPRREKRLIVEDCAALPEALLEAELFGFRKGTTFAGEKIGLGLLELSAGSTLFLDQIDSMPVALQERLARALESGEFTRIGDSMPVKLGDVRLVCGTSLDLGVLVAQGKFSAALYYKINTGFIDLMPRPQNLASLFLLPGLRSEPTQTSAKAATDEIKRFIAELRAITDAAIKATGVEPAPAPPAPTSLSTLLAGFKLLTPDQVARVMAFQDRVKSTTTPPSPPEPASSETPCKPTPPEQDRTRPLFDRLSRRSDRILEVAREEARRLGHAEVGSEHLLLGIAREGSGIGAIVLLELLSDLGKIAPAVAAAREPGRPPIALGFAPSAQAALDTADEAAQDLGRDTVDPEHILIGLSRDLEGSGAILRALGLDPASVEARVRIRLASL